MNEQKKRYANLILEGKLPIDAIMIVWQGITKKTAQNKVGILAKDSGINDYIRESQERIEAKITTKLTTALAKEKVGQILTVARKREILAKIASGKYYTEKTIFVDGKKTKIKVAPDLSDIMKAIELDNKMTGDNVQAKPNQVAKAEEVTKVVVVEDETESPKK
jgi:hypothetical protein